MTKRDLETAASEAERFLKTYREIKVKFGNSLWDRMNVDGRIAGPTIAACKRASLDLTRALAGLRRPT
jgi:hypothetical protein